MKHDINWYVCCHNCMCEIEYGSSIVLDVNNNVYCDEECLLESYVCQHAILDDEIPGQYWEKFDDEF